MPKRLHAALLLLLTLVGFGGAQTIRPSQIQGGAVTTLSGFPSWLPVSKSGSTYTAAPDLTQLTTALPLQSEARRTDPQSALFSRLNSGVLNGQQGWVTNGAATATVAGRNVAVVGNFNTQADYVLSPREFTTGTVRFKVPANTYNFMVMLNQQTSSPTDSLAVWCSSGSGVEIGRVQYAPGASVTSYGSSSAGSQTISTAEDYNVEVTLTGTSTGNTFSVRVWGLSASRPATAGYTYTFSGTENYSLGTRMALRSIGTNTGTISDLTVTDQASTLRAAAQTQGYWYPLAAGGQTWLTTINQGSKLDWSVSGASSLGLNVYGFAAASTPPRVAMRLDGGQWIYRTLAATDGPQTLNFFTGVPTGLHRVQVVASGIHESDAALWPNGRGLLVGSLATNTGAVVSRPVDERQSLLVLGDSITAGIRYYNGGAASSPSNSASEYAYPNALADNLNLRLTQHGFGGTGVSVSGSGSIPKLQANALNYFSTMPLWGEDLPDYVLLNEGTNDNAVATTTFEADLTSALNAFTARWPAARVMVLRPILGYQASGLQRVSAQLGVDYLDSSPWASGVTTTDGTHFDAAGHQYAAQQLTSMLGLRLQQVAPKVAASSSAAGVTLVAANITQQQYSLLATLPASTNDTFDKTEITVVGGLWTSSSTRTDRMVFSNRTGFGATWTVTGGSSAANDSVHVFVLNYSDGTAGVWLTVSPSYNNYQVFLVTTRQVTSNLVNGDHQSIGYVTPGPWVTSLPSSTGIPWNTDTTTPLYQVDSGQFRWAGNQLAVLASPAFTGTPTAPTPVTTDNSTTIPTTAYVKAQGYATLASPTFTGTPAAPTPAAGTNTTQLATTAFVAASYAPLASPALTGTPTAPTAAFTVNNTQLATTAFAKSLGPITTAGSAVTLTASSQTLATYTLPSTGTYKVEVFGALNTTAAGTSANAVVTLNMLGTAQTALTLANSATGLAEFYVAGIVVYGSATSGLTIMQGAASTAFSTSATPALAVLNLGYAPTASVTGVVSITGLLSTASGTTASTTNTRIVVTKLN